MKSRFIYSFPVILFFVLNTNIYSQKVPVFEMIGKKINTVINTYGKPQHRDNSNPVMECLFYQSKDLRMVFVGDNEGVYQAESTKPYSSQSSAMANISSLLADCLAKSIKVDTVNEEDFKITGKEFSADVTLFQNASSKKFEVRIKAGR